MKVMGLLKANNKSVSVNGFWNNKIVLKCLETVSDHSASFIAGANFVMATGIRPLTISATPNVEEKNKQYAIANSIISGGVKFALAASIAIPIENAIKKIVQKPSEFLNKTTIDTYKKSAKTLSKSRDFKFITQFLKQSTGLLTAIPKSMITVALIPILMSKLFKENKIKSDFSKETNLVLRYVAGGNAQTEGLTIKKSSCKSYESRFTPSFKAGIGDITAKGIGHLLDTKILQKGAKKFSAYDTDIARNMTIATDMMLTGTFAYQMIKSNEIEQERKKPLILNNVLGSALTILGGYSVDEIIKNNTKKFQAKFVEINKNNPKLSKYIEGINIVRPTLIFAFIYYGILPMITTYIADKSDKICKLSDGKIK